MAEILKSNRLGQEPVRIGERAGGLDIYDGLETPFSEDVIELLPYHKEQIEDYARRAATHFAPRENQPERTFAQAEFGVPALVVRVDCTVVDGAIVAYEMEDSPSGQGVTEKVHRRVGGAGIKETILTHYAEAIGDTPHVVVSGARSHGTDDPVIVGDHNYTFDSQRSGISIPDNKLVIVKAIPGDSTSLDGYRHLQERALAPFHSEGDKTYLERMGDLAPAAAKDDFLRTDSGELASQVLKSRMGSMAMGVSIYLHPDDRQTYGKKGIVTASRLEKDRQLFEQTRGGALIQPFAPPLRVENGEGESNAIMRVFVLLGAKEGSIEAEAIGGCYVTRPELVVHGARNAVAGAVVTAQEAA
jgi:hypothetical protein